MIAANNHHAFFDHESESDVSLMERVRDGDDAAFTCLMGRHRRYVNWTLSQLVGNPHDMEDMVQEVFMRVFRARDSYEPQAKFSTWLFTITRNVALNSLRKKSRHFEKNLVAGDSVRAFRLDKLALAAESDRPEYLAEQTEVRTVVRYAVSGLNRRQRTAIEMAYLQGKSHRAIANRMNTTPEAVKSLLRRTRCKLRDSLQPYASEGHFALPVS